MDNTRRSWKCSVVVGLLLWFGCAPVWAADPSAKGGGILASMLGGPIKDGLGLSAGDFAEFTLDRIRIVNARMIAPKLMGDTSTDTTFLKVDEIDIEYNPLDILNRHTLKRVVIERPQLWISQLTRKMEEPEEAKKPDPRAQGSKPYQNGSIKLTIQRLELKDVEIYIDTLRVQGLNIPLRFAQKEPLVMENLSLDELLNHPGAEKLVTIDADQVMVHSAFVPMAPLVTVGKLEVGFTWQGLAKRELESVVLSDPALYIGDDWFLLRDEFKKVAQVSQPSPTDALKKMGEENFMVKKFQIQRLKMILSSFGVLKMELPFSFGYEAENVGLDQNGRFFLTSQLQVDQTDLLLPQYHLAIEGLVGDLKFDWPKSEAVHDNIVPTLRARAVKIRDWLFSNPWATLTFLKERSPDDSLAKPISKMFLQFGGEFSGGYVNGYLESDFNRNWVSVVTGTGLGMQTLNAFRALPFQGTFDFKMESEGTGGLVKQSQVSLVNARGIPLEIKFSGDVNEFFKDQQPGHGAPDLSVDLKKEIGDVISTQRLNTGQVQNLKNSRLIGENREGFLEARDPDIEAKYPGATALIKEENQNRLQIYHFIAERDQKTLEAVELEYADIWRELAFPGEWIESPKLGWIEK